MDDPLTSPNPIAHEMISPAPLRPHDTVAIIAPSGPFDPVLGWRGLGWLAARYRLRFSRRLFDRCGYLAGTDDARAEELACAIDDPSIRAIVAMRGGYGAMRITPKIDWTRLCQAPKWIVGFSDITALHLEAAKVGVESLHASMVAELGRGDAQAREAWIRALEHPHDPRSFGGLKTWTPGAARGPLIGGNLTVFASCILAGRANVPHGAILLLEDIGERPYRVDRLLTSLRMGGHLSGCAGVVLGDFTDCFAGPDGTNVEQTLRANLDGLGIPVVAGMPCGHGRPNDPVILGRDVVLNADASTVVLEIVGLDRNTRR